MCRMCDPKIQKPGDKCSYCGKVFAKKAPVPKEAPLKEVAEKKAEKYK